MTDSFDCRVVRMWNEQRDGDYVRRGKAGETVGGCQPNENDIQRPSSSKGSGTAIMLRKMDTPVLRLNLRRNQQR